MIDLNINPLLLVGDTTEKQYFKNYFNDIELVHSNSDALLRYHKNPFVTIFLNDSKKDNALDVCKKIRKNDNQTIIVLLSNFLDKEKLQAFMPLRLSGCIERPFEKNKVEDILFNIQHDLEFLSTDIVKLKDGYHFYIKYQTLYDTYNKEVKLTKNELKLLNLLIISKTIITEESIIYEIWEEDSFEDDEYNLSNRLKNLLYTLRKKLPKNSISNRYRLGYILLRG